MAEVLALVKATSDRLHSSVWEEIGLTAVGEEVDKLRSTLSSIRAALQGAAKLQAVAALRGAAKLQAVDRAVLRWLEDLKEAAYDADDLVDEFEYEVLRSKVVGRGPAGFGRVGALSPRWSLPASVKNFAHQISERVQKIRKRLEEIAVQLFKLGFGHMGGSGEPTDAVEGWEVDFAPAGEASAYSSGEDIEKQITNYFSSSDDESPGSFQENISLSAILGAGALAKGQPVFHRMGSALPVDHPVFGREKDVDEVVKLLKGDVGPAVVSVVSIVGMGGVGKTTLAQLLYNDPRVSEYFHPRIWACVSLDFDVRRITLDMLESASPKKHVDVVDLTSLQDCLGEVLRGKRFLLVLDDVWNEDDSRWEKLRRPFLQGEKGSAVVVTTRSAKVAKLMGTVPPYVLERLTSEDCWKLLEQNAFGREDPHKHPNMRMIGRSIATKMNGVPLAATTLGTFLKSRLDDTFWEQVLASELWEPKEGGDNILPALRLCYQYLPAHLKLCFSYCTIFPRDYIFEKDILVRLWMAQGFIQPQGMKPLEDQGLEYFDNLVSLSFFRPFGNGGFVIHDLVHDLAQSISSRDECLRIEHDDFQKMSESLRHVSLVSDNLEFTGYEKLCKLRSLRTLLFFHRSKGGIQHVPHDLFVYLNSMRVLDLSYGGIEELPDSVYNLIHLRYLGLSHNNMASLPESLSCLLNLQTLDISGCRKLQRLPRGMSNLVRLRHLKSDPELLPSISGIGKLTSLQELPQFKVSKRNGHRIVELKDLSEIRGALCICNLDNVESMQEASMAKLSMKKHLSVLGLEWAPRDDDDDDVTAKPRNIRLEEEVLEALRPPRNVRVLNIRCYDGIQRPSWMETQVLPNLETIVLQGCQRWEQLPPLGELSRLKFLRIEGMKSVRELGRAFHENEGFPSLEELQLYDMVELEEWSDTVDRRLFPRLRKLDIKACPRLRVIPQTPVLVELKTEKVGLIELPEMWLSDAMTADGRSSLVQLRIADCSNLKSLMRKLQPYHLKYLEKLSLTGCKELEVLPEGWFGALKSLKRMTVKDCPKLKPPGHGHCDLPPSLVNLKIGACPGVVNGSLCRSVQSLLSCSSVVSKYYPDLTSCAKEVLHHLTELQMLNLHYDDGPSSLLQAEMIQEVFFSYVVTNDRGQHEDVFMPSRVDLEVRGQCDVSGATIATVSGRLKSLKFLHISGFPTLTSLSLDVLHHLTALQQLTISSCKDLVSLMVQSLCSLECLRVQDCPKLTDIYYMEDHTALKVLIIISCTSLLSLSSERKLPTSLEYLHIENCTQMRSLPDLPASLKELVIEGCPDLERY